MKIIRKLRLAVLAMLIMESVSAQSFLDAGRANYDGAISDNAEASLLLGADINPLDSVSSASMNVKFDAIKYLFDNLPSSGGASSLDGLSDVSTAGVQNNYVLTYNGSSWVAAASQGGSGGIDQTTFDGLESRVATLEGQVGESSITEAYTDNVALESSFNILGDVSLSKKVTNELGSETFFGYQPCVENSDGREIAYIASSLDNDNEEICTSYFEAGVVVDEKFGPDNIVAIIWIAQDSYDVSDLVGGVQATVEVDENSCFLEMFDPVDANGDYINSYAPGTGELNGDFLLDRHIKLYKDQLLTDGAFTESECKQVAERMMNSQAESYPSSDAAGLIPFTSFWFKRHRLPVNIN